MADDTRKHNWKNSQLIAAEEIHKYPEWRENLLALLVKRNYDKKGACSNPCRLARVIFNLPKLNEWEDDFHRPTKHEIIMRMEQQGQDTHGWQGLRVENYLEEALRAEKQELAVEMQLDPKGTSIKATVLMHIIIEKDAMDIPQLQERTLITRGHFPNLTPIREVQTPQTPVQQQATVDLGGGGSAPDDHNNESEDEQPAAADTNESNDEDDTAHNEQPSTVDVNDSQQTINTGTWNLIMSTTKDSIMKRADKLRMKDLIDKNSSWMAADQALRDTMLEGIKDRRQFTGVDTATELKTLIEQYVHASGVAVLTTVMQLNDTYNWKWDTQESVHANSKELLEISDRHLQAFYQLADKASPIGKAMQSALPAMKVTLLLARSHEAFKEPYKSASAQEQLTKLFSTHQNNFEQIYSSIVKMLAQWKSVDNISSNEKGYVANESRGTKVGGEKRCQLCHYSNHSTAECNVKDQPKIQKERRKRVAEQNRKRNEANKEKKEKESARKAKGNVQPDKATTMAIIKQLTEAGWKAPSQPSETSKENAKSVVDLNMFNHLADDNKDE